jgi:hypothetical protein
MTIEELISAANTNASSIYIYMAVMPLIALLFNAVVTVDGFNKGFKYGYTALIYAVCIPGIISILLCIYGFFFIKQNMLQVNILIYFLPIIIMVLTLWIVKRKIGYEYIPGFKRLSSLFLLIAISSILAFLLQKTNIYLGIFAYATIKNLFLVFAIILAVLYVAWRRFMK